MTAISAPQRRQSLLGKIVSAVAARARSRGKPSKLAAVAVEARRHVVTVAALTTMDIGAFQGSMLAGLVVTGASLLLLDFAVTG